jgi:hypothetical protein
MEIHIDGFSGEDYSSGLFLETTIKKWAFIPHWYEDVVVLGRPIYGSMDVFTIPARLEISQTLSG